MCYAQYVDLNISVIPIEPMTKKPYFSRLKDVGWQNGNGKPVWSPASQQIASPDILKAWFADDQSSIALVAGAVSGNLIYLDWDKPLQYKKWAMSHKDIVNQTAVSKTASGYHVFFRFPMGITAAGCNMYFQGQHSGEVRGEGMYVVAAPSIHPSGVAYQWLRHPRDGIVEIKNLAAIDIDPPPRKLDNFEYDTSPVSQNDEVLILKAMSAKWQGDTFVRLWGGDFSNYPSQSEADLGLCRILAFWTGRDTSRINSLFRRSGLYRQKWNRKNQDGSTYGSRTIDMACRSTNQVYVVNRRYRWRSI